MRNVDNLVLYDSVKEIKVHGQYMGSIISKCRDDFNSIIFSDNIKISSDSISISQGLKVGFEKNLNKKIAFSRKSDFRWENDLTSLEYSVIIPNKVMELYDEGQVSSTFPFTINMLHTAGLYLNEREFGTNHLDFFIGEILKNPVCVIFNGICVADRVVIDDMGDPVFYSALIVGRDRNDDLKVSYEPLVNVDDKVVEYIIILGHEELQV